MVKRKSSTRNFSNQEGGGKNRQVRWKIQKSVTNYISHASPPVNFDIPIPDRQCIRLVHERHPSRSLPLHGLTGGGGTWACVTQLKPTWTFSRRASPGKIKILIIEQPVVTPTFASHLFFFFSSLPHDQSFFLLSMPSLCMRSTSTLPIIQFAYGTGIVPIPGRNLPFIFIHPKTTLDSTS